MKKILFILKYRHGYGDANEYFSSGLYWSAKFVVDMLVESGAEAKLVHVHDNNNIDREVSRYRPDIVIIEALWVVPEKFDVLQKLYPNVTWIVRLHSDLPFLANEGVAVGWIKGYRQRGVQVAFNCLQIANHFRTLYLPNFYPQHPLPRKIRPTDDFIHVACYGAVRPMKNQLAQAVAAMTFASSIGKHLCFYVNSSRVENGGHSILRNLRHLFSGSPHFLIEDPWMHHSDFLARLQQMDIGMQVSLSETFCIVAADMVAAGVPVVVSSEVRWASCISKAKPTEIRDMVRKLSRAYRFPKWIVKLNRIKLASLEQKVKNIWFAFLSPGC